MANSSSTSTASCRSTLLQARLHPADSRIRKLSAETPAGLILFDILVTPDGENVIDAPLVKRRAALETLVAACGVPGRLTLSPVSRDRCAAQEWLHAAGRGAPDGVVAKRLDSAYAPGERAMIKVKPRRTADCVVGGFRYQTVGPQVGSLLLGLYDAAGRLNHVGFTATIANRERPALTHKLEALIEPPGFTGTAPGGPSRWSTERSGAWQPLRPELVVEVEYNQVTGGRFRHGTKLVRWRPDKAASQCTLDQIAPAQIAPGRITETAVCPGSAEPGAGEYSQPVSSPQSHKDAGDDQRDADHDSGGQRTAKDH